MDITILKTTPLSQKEKVDHCITFVSKTRYEEAKADNPTILPK